SPNRTTGWIVEGCEIRYNAAAGVGLGHKMKVLRNNIHHNGQIGIAGTGDSILIEGNEIAYNNYQHTYSYGFEAGGTKFTRTRWLVVRGNYSHHNWGSGLWTDIDNIHTLYESNRVSDNAAQGIFHEISYDAVIRNNIIERNGFEKTWYYGAGIQINHSPNVEVYGNTVTGNQNGIIGLQQDRGSGAYGPHLLSNLHVHDNTITVGSGRSGVAQDVGDNTIFTDRNNRFAQNIYYVGTNSTPFAWLNGNRTISQWQSYGQDQSGIFNR
ncbi:MAG: right-handed parallel beta-helix repeat-containing protein, partial [Chloroflexota bacterium]|nr:right-handed parallel beta-helix repeat-containing protein [Chloroflexota bacterium]